MKMDSDIEESLIESANWMEDEKLLAKIDDDLDYALALSLQEEINEETSCTPKEKLIANLSVKQSNANTKAIIDPEWELIDPNPNIQALFLEFNAEYFYSKLGGVEVKWSNNMTLCAGVCSYEGRGGLCSIRLSMPLLKLRPRKDLVETLLHEMIHAYLFVTANFKDRQDHGPNFLSHMYRINKATGANITVYHSFHDEVDFYRKHWWKCDGPCQYRKPYYGIVKRAMNRAPCPRDPWWSQHQATCGGTYHKFKEPDDYKQKNAKRKRPSESVTSAKSPGIEDFFPKQPSASSSTSVKRPKEDSVSTIHQIFGKEDNTVLIGRDPPVPPLRENNFPIVPFSGKGFTLGSSDKQAPKSYLWNIRKELGGVEKNVGLNASKLRINNEGKTSLGGIGSTKPPTMTPSKTVQTTIKSHFTQPSSVPMVGFEQKSHPSSKSVDNTRNDLQNPPAEASNFKTVPCPVCTVLCSERDINSHLDECLFLNS